MDDPEPKGLSGVLTGAVETALLPLQAAVSKPAQRAYLGTFLFAATSILLLCISSVAYTLFYYNYVPQNSVERIVHLQFGDGHPHGTAQLSTSLTSFQPYDITLSLHLPRTPSNLAAGNFMLDLSLFGPTSRSSSFSSTRPSHPTTTTTAPLLLAHSRRPAILTYTSPLIATLSTLSALPWYILGWKSESERLTITMFEGVEFGRGTANVPQSARVVVESATTAKDEKEEEQSQIRRRESQMQFYEVRMHIIARLGGLRWIMYQHRILSFLFFTTTFWSSAMISMTLVWLALSSMTGSSSSSSNIKLEKPSEKTAANGPAVAIKREKEDEEEDIKFDPASLLADLSDTPRTFPSTPGGRRFGPRAPLRFEGRKEEEDEFVRQQQPLTATAAEAEADDEDEYDDEDDDVMMPETSGFRDSGIGTGLDEERLASVQRQQQRRRKGGTRRDS